jgi:hypothetical protein
MRGSSGTLPNSPFLQPKVVARFKDGTVLLYTSLGVCAEPSLPHGFDVKG